MPELIIISYEYFTKLISETHRETMILFIMTPDDVDYNHSMKYTCEMGKSNIGLGLELLERLKL